MELKSTIWVHLKGNDTQLVRRHFETCLSQSQQHWKMFPQLHKVSRIHSEKRQQTAFLLDTFWENYKSKLVGQFGAHIIENKTLGEHSRAKILIFHWKGHVGQMHAHSDQYLRHKASIPFGPFDGSLAARFLRAWEDLRFPQDSFLPATIAKSPSTSYQR
jgi:hypothetical protein